MKDKKTGLYIHIPFCVRKCNYCAFLSFDAETSPRREYADALVNEIRIRAKQLGHPRIDTIYAGGGTPSVLDIAQMRNIMHAVKTSFEVSPDAEITIEANPGTLGRKDGVTLAKLQAYRFMGFNRISMGVQSMDNSRLHFMGRIHTAENVARDMELIRRKGFSNVNLDLIFSVPGSSTQDSLEDLERILALRPEHISCYSLQIEEGTPFARMAESGEISEVSDEDDRRTYHKICRMLKEAGYEHYEISNFARMDHAEADVIAPGFETDCCSEGNILKTYRFADASAKAGTYTNTNKNTDTRKSICETTGNSTGKDIDAKSRYRSKHNSLYWDMSDYIGLGLGASGFVSGVRYKNTSDIEEYIENFYPMRSSDGEHFRFPLEEEHLNTSFDNISEAVFTGLRRREGITYEEAVSSFRCGRDSVGIAEPAKTEFWRIFAEAKAEAEEYAKRGLLIIDEKGLRLTEQGIDISNSIMSMFV